ncbi:MAG: hypothetical protein IJA47_01370 [Oscillospiraceae bacterium]|nr:hypothetical protein [Oscillospiraceae bacterium]
MRYENQREHPHMLYVTRQALEDEKQREYGKTTTMRSSGCGLCAGIMALDRLLPHYEFSLEDAIQLSYDAKANLKVGTDYTCFGPALAEKFNLRYKMSDKLEDLRNCVRAGGAAVVLVGCPEEGKPGLFTKSSHFITVINEEPDGRLAILDPSFTPTKYETEDRKDKVEIKHGVVILCKPEILHAETKDKTGSYYLFWRA